MRAGVPIPTLQLLPVSPLSPSPHLPPARHWMPVNRESAFFSASRWLYIRHRGPDDKKKKKKRKRDDDSDDDLGTVRTI